MARASFIRSMHPKKSLQPNPETIARILDLGWVGQLKIHGHRSQIHIHADENIDPIVFNRQGQVHKKHLSPEMIAELRRIIEPTQDWSVIDSEWVKKEDRIYIFDFLKQNGELLRDQTYQQRYALIPRDYLSPHFQTLPLLDTLKKCTDALSRSESYIEGIVLKSLNTPGFEDTSIIRCRKK